MPRIRPIPGDEAEEEVRALYARAEEEFGRVPNLLATMAHHPPSLGPLLDYFRAVYHDARLPPRLLELAVIQVSFALQSAYCLTLHKAFALERGVPAEEVMALREEGGRERFEEAERLVLEYAARYAADPIGIPDDLVEGMRAHYSEAQIVSLTLLIGLAAMLGRVANALQIPPDGTPESV